MIYNEKERLKIEKQNSKPQFEAKPFFDTLGILHTNSVWHGKLTKALQKWQHQGKVKTIGSLKIVENLSTFRSNFAIFAKPRPLASMPVCLRTNAVIRFLKIKNISIKQNSFFEV